MAWYEWRRPFDPVVDAGLESCERDGWLYMETNHYALPPTNQSSWERVYSFGVSSVTGGGMSPPRSSVRKVR